MNKIYKDDLIFIAAEYSHSFKNVMKCFGAKWDSNNRMWKVNKKMELELDQILIDIFGYTDKNDCIFIDVYMDFSDCDNEIEAFGQMIRGEKWGKYHWADNVYQVSHNIIKVLDVPIALLDKEKKKYKLTVCQNEKIEKKESVISIDIGLTDTKKLIEELNKRGYKVIEKEIEIPNELKD